MKRIAARVGDPGRHFFTGLPRAVLSQNDPPIPALSLYSVRTAVEKAVMQQPHRGNAVWWVCLTCEQQLTGAMRTGLAEASWSRVRVEAEESAERRCAVVNLADARVTKRGTRRRSE
jgi:hypothetical protein